MRPTSANAGAVEELGPIEILVNNVGSTRDSTLHKMEFETWGQVIHTNLASCFNIPRCLIKSMGQRAFGRIVIIGSINGQSGRYG